MWSASWITKLDLKWRIQFEKNTPGQELMFEMLSHLSVQFTRTHQSDFSMILVLKTSSWSRLTVQKQSLILLGPGYGGMFLASPAGGKERKWVIIIIITRKCSFRHTVWSERNNNNKKKFMAGSQVVHHKWLLQCSDASCTVSQY